MRRLGALGHACMRSASGNASSAGLGACCLPRDAGSPSGGGSWGPRRRGASAGGEVGGGASIRSAVHLRYLGHVANEQVERDVPASMRDSTSIRRRQPRTTDSGVQLTQRRYLRDVGRKHPGETILAKQPAGQPSVPSGGGTNRPSMGNVQSGDGWHRGNKGGEPARQRIPCDVPAALPAANAVQQHSGDTWP